MPGPASRPCTPARSTPPVPPGYRRPDEASAPRRVLARLVDALLVLVLTGGSLAALIQVNDRGLIGDAASAAAIVGAYALWLGLLGALYGRRLSPGQALLGVESLLETTLRRVGAWRGVGRYLTVGFFPLSVIWLVLAWFETPAPSEHRARVRVYRRR